MTPPRIVATSDIHGNLPETPECDILIVAGDICPDYLHLRHTGVDIDSQLQWLDEEFRPWLKAQPAKHIVGIAGNHDFALEEQHAEFDGLKLPWHYLRDSAVDLEGVKFWGLPWVPDLRSWAFYGSDPYLKTVYGLVPSDTDIVISHGPPYRVCDRVGHRFVGAKEALAMIKRVQPKAFVCGHIHEAFGEEPCYGVPVYNVSYVDEFYVPQDRFGIIPV